MWLNGAKPAYLKCTTPRSYGLSVRTFAYQKVVDRTCAGTSFPVQTDIFVQTVLSSVAFRLNGDKTFVEWVYLFFALSVNTSYPRRLNT